MTALWILSGVLAFLALSLGGALVIARRHKRRLRQRLRALEGVAAELNAARARVYELQIGGRLEAEGGAPRLPLRFTSQYGEDRFLWDLFEGAREGCFIEVGAYDGVSLSVSYPFEAVGWTGYLIEALQDRYEECVRNRPHSRVVRAALTRPGRGDRGQFTRVSGTSGGDMRSYLDTHAEHSAQIAGAGAREEDGRLEVPLATMDDILAEHEGPIDFASIDVEGSEADVLSGFDLERFRPRVLLVEDTRKRMADEIGPVVLPRGYVEAGRIGCSRVFIRSDEPGLLARYAAAAATCPR